MVAGQEQVGLDKSNPNAALQNTVPAPYQQDPFAGAQLFEDGQSRGQTSGGFRTRPSAQPKYYDDPLATGENKFRTERENIEQFGTADQVAQFDKAEEEREQMQQRLTRLEQYKEGNELTQENVADVYSLKEDELGLYGIDINKANDEGAPENIVSGWNDADGDGFDDDGHAMGSHGAVNVQTRAGEDSIQSLLDAAGTEGDLTEPTWADKLKSGAGWVTDKATQYAQPKEVMTSWGDTFTTGPGGAIGAALPGPIGGLAAIGGELSRRSLENIHEKHGTYGSSDAGYGVIPKETIPGVTTPLGIQKGPFGDVVTGNTDLVMQQNPEIDLNGDGALNAREIQDYMAQQKQLEEAQKIEDQRLRMEAEKKAAAAKAAQERRQAQERSQREARAQEEARRAEAQRRANESGREQTYGGGSAVTDRHGNAVRDSRGQTVTDRMVTVQPQRNDDGGGGGGDSCFAKGTLFRMKDKSLKAIEDIVVGDLMDMGGRVYGILQGDGQLEDWYNYDGVYVTGSHFVYEEGRWVSVESSKRATFVLGGFDTWYCVLNSNHKMVSEDEILFTDFDAVDSVNKELEERLNAVQKR